MRQSQVKGSSMLWNSQNAAVVVWLIDKVHELEAGESN
jgi:hypothetical protein